MKFVVVSGSVCSGLGKGITSSSLGAVLEACGYSVTAIKIDGYLNCDAGTIAPSQHGETYVLDDGGETDLDMGSYERFLQQSNFTKSHNLTSGKLYTKVLAAEREGRYLGQTVQVMPHLTREVINWISEVSDSTVIENKKADICMIELGGTVGDHETMVFIEALRQMQLKVGREGMCWVHVTLVPSLQGEHKTKPAQHGIRDLRAAGITPDFIACRSTMPMSDEAVGKIAEFAMVPRSHIWGLHDVSNIYRVPWLLRSLPTIVLGRLNAPCPSDELIETKLKHWDRWAETVDRTFDRTVTIAIVGKYVNATDAYLSVSHAVRHAALASSKFGIRIVWIDAEKLDQNDDAAWTSLSKADGVIIPGGFGVRGIEGMIKAAHFARTNKKPCLGICLGLQIMVIEYARSQLGIKDATSEEFNQIGTHVVVPMPEHSPTATKGMGGTMRLGLRQTNIKDGSIAQKIYGGAKSVKERHRHRYEINPLFVAKLESAGLRISGVAEKMHEKDDDVRCEMIELPQETHPFFFGVQFHPEFLSRPQRPSPPFVGLLASCAPS